MDKEIDLDKLLLRYPSGSSRLEKEIDSLKRKLDGPDLCENDEVAKRKTTNPKNTGFSCLECGSVSRKNNI